MLTFDIAVLDEAQKISNYTVSERILPMLGATNGKIIKIGTPRSRNHFYDSVEGKGSQDGWTVIRKSWTECAQLHSLNSIMLPDIKDPTKMRPYSSYVLSLCPKSIKMEMFPNNPEIWLEGFDFYNY